MPLQELSMTMDATIIFLYCLAVAADAMPCNFLEDNTSSTGLSHPPLASDQLIEPIHFKKNQKPKFHQIELLTSPDSSLTL
jgi:hypothetical protein